MNHVERAKKLFLDGCNCSQAVFLAFGDVTGMDEKTALKLSSSFGGGMGRMREVCGAVSGMFMVAGMLYGYDDTDSGSRKRDHYALIQEMANRFKERHGSIVCRDLLKSVKTEPGAAPTERTSKFYNERPCIGCVMDAADIMDEIIEEKSKKTISRTNKNTAV